MGIPAATGAFTSLLNQIGLAAKLITSRVRRAGLADMLGYTGRDERAGRGGAEARRVRQRDAHPGARRGAATARRSRARSSSELEVFSTDPRAKYIVVFDPLDGSSNIDVNISIGTIFGILRAQEHRASR